MPRLTTNAFALFGRCFKPRGSAGADAAQTPAASPSAELTGSLGRAPVPSADGAIEGRRRSTLPRSNNTPQGAEQVEAEAPATLTRIEEADEFVEVDATQSPKLMQTQHATSMRSAHVEDLSASLPCTSLPMYLLGNKVSASQGKMLELVYEELLSRQEVSTFLIAQKIINEAAQTPAGIENLCALISKFNNKALGVLMIGAVGGDAGLIVDFSTVLNKVSKKHSMRFTIDSFAEFAHNKTISELGKQDLLKIVLKAALQHRNPAFECTALLGSLGAIAERIKTSHLCELGYFYLHVLLPNCESAAQIKAAANPEQDFLHLLVETSSKEIYNLNKLLIGLYERKCEQLKHSKISSEVSVKKTDLVEVFKKLMYKFSEESSIKQFEEQVEYLSNYLRDVHSSADDYVNTTRDPFLHQEVIDNCPTLHAIAKQAQSTNNANLLRYAKLAAFLMLDTAAPVRESAFVKNMLIAIAKFYGEATRLPAMVCFYQSIREPEIAIQFEAFTAGFKKRAQIFAGPIFILSGYGQHVDKLCTLIAMVNTKRFKDTKKALPILEFVCDMAAYKTMAAKDKCHIVQRLVEDAKDVKTGITLEMVGVSGLAKLAGVDQSDSAAATTVLKDIAQGGNIHQVKAQLFKLLYGVADHEAAAFTSAYENYLETARTPTALPAYATSIYMSNIDGREKAMVEIGLIARGLVANDGGVTLNKIRYGTENNDHNKLMQAKAPAAWKAWQEEVSFEGDIEYTDADLGVKVNCKRYLAEKIVFDNHVKAGTFEQLELVVNCHMPVEEVLRDLNIKPQGKHQAIEKQLLLALRPKLSNRERAVHLQKSLDLGINTRFPQLSQDIKDLCKRLIADKLDIEKVTTLHACISSRPEDLFLIGTEVGGSCQSVYSEPYTNIALPGFVLDGKYLSAQVSNTEGRLMCRRMLRLVWSEKLNAPVIHIEREYTNPGVPQKIKDACLELVFDKAEKMGVRVATNDQALITSHGPKEDSKEELTLSAYKTPRAFEYVDAGYGIQSAGVYSINSAVVLHR
jgi:hypothetical protein